MTPLPKYIDDYIFSELQAEYSPGYRNIEHFNVDFNLNNSEYGNKIYLGTYFPRSWVESFTIFNELFSKNIIKSKIETRTFLNILDIGTGTGGNIIGLLESLRINGLYNKKINLVTVEGNKIAIEYQKKLVQLFCKRHNLEINHICKELILTKDSIVDFFNLLNNKNIKFDIVSSFKFASEYYNIQSSINDALNTKYFKLLANQVSRVLLPSGFFLFLDLCSCNFGHPKFRDYTPIIMTKEIKEFVNENKDNISFLIPITCALWSGICRTNECYTERIFQVKHSKTGQTYERSKVTYKVFSRPIFAKEVIDSVVKKQKYQTCFGVKPKYCSDGCLTSFQNNIVDLPNGFKFE
jgi:SAM-dependent methyltransferase